MANAIVAAVQFVGAHLGTAIQIAGTAAAAYGVSQEASATAKAAKYNAAVARNNAQAIRDQSDFEQKLARDRQRRLRGAQVATGLKQGRELSGSLIDVIFDSEVQQELDMMSNIYKSRVAAGSEIARSKLFTMEASSAKSAGRTSAVGTLLTGTGSALSSYRPKGLIQ